MLGVISDNRYREVVDTRGSTGGDRDGGGRNTSRGGAER